MKQNNIAEILKNIELFVLDMDGTIYLGNRLYTYTHKFLDTVKKSGRDFCFFTNNSSKNRGSYIQKLKNMQIDIPDSKMLISNDVIIKWLLENHRGESAYIVGTPDLLEDFQTQGIVLDDENPDYVILGFDTTLTYEKLSKACTFIRNGKPVYGVNPDFNCPVEGGFIPDCGSIAALVQASTGVSCEFFGKPSQHTLNYFLEFTGYSADKVAIVGDRLYTDIATAQGSEVTSILVLSGETQLKDLQNSEIQPDIVTENIGVLTQYL